MAPGSWFENAVKNQKAKGYSIVRSQGMNLPITGDIPAASLTGLEDYLNGIRKLGLKVILRFAYDDIGLKPAPPIATVIRHINQLGPVCSRHTDVILVLEAGMAGFYGENHSDMSDNDAAHPYTTEERNAIRATHDALITPTNTVAMIDAWLSSWTGRLALRTMKIMKMKWPNLANIPARVGLHNDAIFSIDRRYETNVPVGYMGTELSTWGVDDFNQYKALVATSPRVYGGEIGYGEHWPKSISAMDKYGLETRLTYLNTENAAWKVFSDEMNAQDRNIIPAFAGKLGYRLYIKSLSIQTNIKVGDDAIVRMSIVSDGYSAPIGDRKVVLVVKTANGSSVELPVNGINLTTLLPSADEYELEGRVTIPQAIELGDATISIKMPDPSASLAARAEYSIRPNNADSGTARWNSVAGAFETGLTFRIEPKSVSSFVYAGPIYTATADGFKQTGFVGKYLGGTNPWNTWPRGEGANIPAGWMGNCGIGNYDASTGKIDIELEWKYLPGTQTTGSDILCYHQVSYGIGANAVNMQTGKSVGPTPGSMLPAQVSNIKTLFANNDAVIIDESSVGIAQVSDDFFIMFPGGPIDRVPDGPFKAAEIMIQRADVNGYGQINFGPGAVDRKGILQGANKDQFIERIKIGDNLFDILYGPPHPFDWTMNAQTGNYVGSVRRFKPNSQYNAGDRYSGYDGAVWTCTKSGVSDANPPAAPVGKQLWEVINARVSLINGSAEFLPSWNLWSNSWAFIKFLRVQHPVGYAMNVDYALLRDYMYNRGWIENDWMWMGVEMGIEVAQNSTTNPWWRSCVNYSVTPNVIDNKQFVGTGVGNPTRQFLTPAQRGDDGHTGKATLRGWNVYGSLYDPSATLPTPTPTLLPAPRNYLHALNPGWKRADGSTGPNWSR